MGERDYNDEGTRYTLNDQRIEMIDSVKTTRIAQVHHATCATSM